MSDLIERVAEALWRIDGRTFHQDGWKGISAYEQGIWRRNARAAIEAMREPSNDVLGAGYEAMFVDKWDCTQAPMMDAGFDAMIDAALDDDR